jgi:AraC family transcriptional regulator
MSYEQVELEPIRLVAVSHSGAYNTIGKAFDQLMGICKANGIPFAETIGVYHDDPNETPEAELRAHAGMKISDDQVLPEGCEEFIIPGGLYVKTLHKGSYSGLWPAWQKFMTEGIESTGKDYDIGKCDFEVYLNDCSEVPEEELLTELYSGIC